MVIIGPLGRIRPVTVNGGCQFQSWGGSGGKGHQGTDSAALAMATIAAPRHLAPSTREGALKPPALGRREQRPGEAADLLGGVELCGACLHHPGERLATRPGVAALEH